MHLISPARRVQKRLLCTGYTYTFIRWLPSEAVPSKAYTYSTYLVTLSLDISTYSTLDHRIYQSREENTEAQDQDKTVFISYQTNISILYS